ncbi:hypothetical protein [Priestia megaterium]|uniref:hypothetical protein n=1 Tax=Priestia megaterium TaxID=1404 RepID=UPI0011A990E7|nr:hypothetical protein [Priestia megaterium]
MKELDLNTTMDSFNLFKESSLFLQIYVLNKGGNYGNIFTSIRNRDLEVFDWVISDYNDYLIKIEGCFPSSIVEEFFVDITKNGLLRIKGHGIQFGEVTKRSWVFIPYEQQNSVSNGWWPGTLNTGFGCNSGIV